MSQLLRLSLFIFLIVFISQVRAMGLFDFFTIHVFSDVTGIVTMNGEPVKGAEIIRTADHVNDKLYSDSTKSDENGNFSLPDISTFSLRPIMMPTVIFQKMIIKYQGMEYLAWDATKRTNHKYGELNDNDNTTPIKLKISCELTDNQTNKKRVELKHLDSIVIGLCRW